MVFACCSFPVVTSTHYDSFPLFTCNQVISFQCSCQLKYAASPCPTRAWKPNHSHESMHECFKENSQWWRPQEFTGTWFTFCSPDPALHWFQCGCSWNPLALLGYQVKEQHTSRKAAAENRDFTPNLKEKKNPPSDSVTIHNVKIFWKCTKLTSHSPLEIRFVSDELGLCCN